MEVAPSGSFESVVVEATGYEHKNLFVIACQYAIARFAQRLPDAASTRRTGSSARLI
jgi:hypothetical protein